MSKKIIISIVVAGLLIAARNTAAEEKARVSQSEMYMPGSGITVEQAKAFLRSVMPAQDEVKNFLAGKQGHEKISYNDGWVYDRDLGWIVCDSVRPRFGQKYKGVYLPYGLGGSRTFYHYEEDGARKVINFPNRHCRIHTYGDSFTHCDQVNDGETWQEYLAAHLQEPIRNYGVGGYGVYQAYLRMLKVEKQRPADYIILNIYDDDHYRNLDAWRSIRWWYTEPGARWACGYTLPHLKVNVKDNRCEQVENLLKRAEDVYKLCDEEFVWEAFKDDPVLEVVLAIRAGEKTCAKLAESIADNFGIPIETVSGCQTAAEKVQKILTEAALFATKNIISWTEQFAGDNDKKLMIILSFSQSKAAADLRGEPRFDQTLVDWLKAKSYPVIDMRDVFRADYKQYNLDVDTYLKRYYIGHHSPAGNYFAAQAIKDKAVKWLDPPPLPYR
jgi:hypothetical protein